MRLIDIDAIPIREMNYPVWVCLTKQPRVDAVSVVRCKDCKYWQDNNGGYPHEECRWGHDETPDPDDFCSYGERRSDGEE